MTEYITGFVDYGEGTLEHKFTELHRAHYTYVNSDGQGVNFSFELTNHSFCYNRYDIPSV